MFSSCEEKINVKVLPAHGATPEQQTFISRFDQVHRSCVNKQVLLSAPIGVRLRPKGLDPL